jgi:hypothetical protein
MNAGQITDLSEKLPGICVSASTISCAALSRFVVVQIPKLSIDLVLTALRSARPTPPRTSFGSTERESGRDADRRPKRKVARHGRPYRAGARGHHHLQLAAVFDCVRRRGTARMRSLSLCGQSGCTRRRNRAVCRRHARSGIDVRLSSKRAPRHEKQNQNCRRDFERGDHV